MKTATTTILGNEIEIYYANSRPSGYGHRAIMVELWLGRESKIFKAVTSDMPGFDDANELEGEEKALALYELIEYQIIDSVEEWINELKN